MIKLVKINDLEVKKSWGQGAMKPLFENQIRITGENLYFPNILIPSSKGAGKTTLAFNIINQLLTNKSKLVCFSTTFSSGDDSDAFDELKEKYPGMIEVYPRLKTKEGDVLLTKIDEAKERYDLIKKKDYQHTFPNYIFLFDDLSSDDIRSESLEYLFRTNRHIGACTILIEHRFNQCPPIVRDNVDIICIFKGMSLGQLDDIFSMINIPNLTKKDFVRIYNKAVEGKNNFLFINKTNNQMRKNLSELIILE